MCFPRFFKIVFLGFLLVYFIPVSGQYTDSQVVKKGAQLQIISDQFSFTEGPAVNAKGEVYFTDQPNNRIYIWSKRKGLRLFTDESGRSNGLYFDKYGNLLGCADGDNQLWRFKENNKIEVLADSYEGRRFNGPNDLWVDASNGIYFTDPFYLRPYWKHDKPEMDGEQVYYLPAGSNNAIPLTDDLLQPNGIVGTPDGKFLYVADIKANKTYRYIIQSKGKLTDKQLFTDLGSDGMTLDNQGNLYLTGDGVTVFDSTGKQIEHIAVPEAWTANVCFAGKKQNLLFITASKSVYVIRMRVRGVE
jgi:gluconolactonase